jgi:hypothetical protein
MLSADKTALWRNSSLHELRSFPVFFHRVQCGNDAHCTAHFVGRFIGIKKAQSPNNRLSRIVSRDARCRVRLMIGNFCFMVSDSDTMAVIPPGRQSVISASENESTE